MARKFANILEIVGHTPVVRINEPAPLADGWHGLGIEDHVPMRDYLKRRGMLG